MGVIDCAGGRAAHFSDRSRQIVMIILLKRSKNWPHSPPLLATIAQIRQAPGQSLNCAAMSGISRGTFGEASRLADAWAGGRKRESLAVCRPFLPRCGCRRGRATPVGPKVPVGARVKAGCRVGSSVAGFTLIEVLVVLVLIGIIISFAVLKVGGDQRADELDRAARTFAAVLELASDMAISRGEEWGVRVDSEGYRFLVLGQDEQDAEKKEKWIDVENDPVFRSRAWDRGMRVELELEGRDTVLEDADEEQDKPSILLLSSGEMTPFIATFSAPETEARAQVEGDALGNVETAMLEGF